MSWLTNRNSQNAANYRYIQFEGGRILQMKEMSDLLETDTLRAQYTQHAVFREGATANALASISGSSLSLARQRSEIPVMLVCLNGYFEPFAAQTIALPAPRTSGTDTLYAHWVLWRVTYDGYYQGSPGCLVDASLIDQVTSEAVAERGQLQVIFSFDTALSDEVRDTVRMISKSTVAVPVFQVAWTASVPAVVNQDIFQLYLVGTPDRLGLVKLTTPTADTAAATDDARLSDARVPVDASVSTLKVSLPVATGGTTDIASPEVATGSSDGGVDVSRLWWGTLRAKVSDVLGYLYTQLGAALAALTGLDARVTALEHRAAPVVDLSYHVGKPLGRTADGGFTHVPTVTDPFSGFRHVGPPQPPQAGVSYNELGYAFLAVAQNNVPVGGISMTGNYVLLNPHDKAVLDSLALGHYDLTNFFSLAQLVGLMAQRGGYFS